MQNRSGDMQLATYGVTLNRGGLNCRCDCISRLVYQVLSVMCDKLDKFT